MCVHRTECLLSCPSNRVSPQKPINKENEWVCLHHRLQSCKLALRSGSWARDVALGQSTKDTFAVNSSSETTCIHSPRSTTVKLTDDRIIVPICPEAKRIPSLIWETVFGKNILQKLLFTKINVTTSVLTLRQRKGEAALPPPPLRKLLWSLRQSKHSSDPWSAIKCYKAENLQSNPRDLSLINTQVTILWRNSH